MSTPLLPNAASQTSNADSGPRSRRDSRTWSRLLFSLEAAWRALPRSVLFALGVAVLVSTSLDAFGGRTLLYEYSAHTVHKLTATGMMEGTLRLRRGLVALGHDEQAYNGAGYTNWGYGVPLLQIPFHALARLLHLTRTRLFPDRLIFFIYLTGLVPLLWSSLQRGIFRASSRSNRVSCWVFTWCATLLVLTFTLFNLLSYRFIVYEETIAYFVVSQLYAISFYSRSLDSKESKGMLLACAVGVAAGFGLLIRPTGLIYLAMWGALVVLNDKRARVAVGFAAVAGPFVAFWAYGNWVRTGSPLSTGFQNCNPGYPIHYAMLRFGSQCANTPARAWDTGIALFEGLFLQFPENTPFMTWCGFAFDRRLPTELSILPPVVLVLLCGTLVYYIGRKETKLASYIPHATFILVFGAYVTAGAGMSWRYGGDLWPAIVLIAIQISRRCRFERWDTARPILASAFVLYSFVAFVAEVRPSLPSIDVMSAARMIGVEEERRRGATLEQPAIPSRLACGDALAPWPYANGAGWLARCEVNMITNLYLGVPKKPGTAYQLRFRTDRPLTPSLQVFINGKIYKATRGGEEYVVSFDLDYRKLYTPAVLVTVEWTKETAPPGVRLMAIELL